MGVLRRLLGRTEGPSGEESGVPAHLRRPPRPDPKAAHHYVVVVLDSCRHDTFLEAQPKNILRLGEVQRRYSYASWTAPSHYNLLMGLLPHRSPPHVFASDYYKEDFRNYDRRLGAEGIEFGSLVPSLYLPTYLRQELGYMTHARVSLPVLNPATPLNRDFDTYQLMERHNDMAAMLDTMTFSSFRPSFFLLNVGETHFPYATPDEDPEDWPVVHGENGVFRPLDPTHVGGQLLRDEETSREFDQDRLDQLRRRQVRAVQHLDSVFEKLYDLVPDNTYLIVTSDHGELFGEDGYFGHGPIQHDLVYEVPYLEGKIR